MVPISMVGKEKKVEQFACNNAEVSAMEDTWEYEQDSLHRSIR